MIPLKDQIACVKREIANRRRVYPGRVEFDRLSAKAMTKEIETMEAVQKTLEGLRQTQVEMNLSHNPPR